MGSRDNSLYAIDAEKGSVLWKRAYPNNAPPPIADSNNCPNNMNATPVVDRQNGIIYFLPNDGKLRGLSLSEGEERFPATRIVPQYTRNFSLNLVDGRIYTGTTRGCGNTVSRVVSIDVTDPDRTVTTFYTSTGKASGPWGRVLMAFTVEGPADKPTLQPQWMSGDLDLPGVAVVANGVVLILANGDRGATLIPNAGGRGGRGGAGAGDAEAPAGGGRGGAAGRGPGGAPSVMQPNSAEAGFERDEAWLASQRRPFEEGGQKAGTRYSGGRDTTHAVLYALDLASGDEIYSSGDAMDSWNHYGGLALSDGMIYITTWHGRIFAFGREK